MTLDERTALEALRRRLSHAEAICDLLTRHSTDELAEGMRGVGIMLGDAIIALDAVAD